MHGQPLSCEESSAFEACKQAIISQLGINDAEFDEAYLFPLQQLIVYNPTIYPEVEGTHLRVFATDATPKYPSIYIAYTFDDERITLRFAELKQVDNEQETI